MDIQASIEEIWAYLESQSAILVVLVCIAGIAFIRVLLKFLKRRKGYSAKQTQEIRGAARRRW
jgi:hypothetical protein